MYRGGYEFHGCASGHHLGDHLDILNQNPVVMIARIFNMLPVSVKMLEDGRKLICKVREIVYKYQFYDMNEFFTCKFDL
jgi:hypothetical protein